MQGIRRTHCHDDEANEGAMKKKAKKLWCDLKMTQRHQKNEINIETLFGNAFLTFHSQLGGLHCLLQHD